ncbi:MAG TPA: ATP-binding protein [Candidatus Nanopelagicaceae bacterium]
MLSTAIASGWLVVSEQSMLIRGLDASGQLRINDIQAALTDHVLPPEITVIGDDSVFVQLLGSKGQIISTTKNIAGEAALITPPVFKGHKDALVTENRVINAFDNVHFRIIAQQIVVRGQKYVVVAGYSLEKTNSSILYLIKLLIALNILVTMLVYLVTWVVTGRALRPVERMRTEVDQLSAKDLSRRVSVPRSDDEIGRLGRTLNSMLDRLEVSDQKQRRFVSDASHELRNPLAGMRTQLEVELLYPEVNRGEESRKALLRSTLRLQELTEDLLVLAVSDSGAPTMNWKQFDLGEIILREIEEFPLSPVAIIDTRNVEKVLICGSESQLRRVFVNLLENANRFAESQIEVSLRADGDSAILEVADDGPGVPFADRERIFERFSRLDNSRSRHEGGAGLGLAIAKEIVLMHGGDIRLLDEAHGAHFLIRIPLNQEVVSSTSL